MDFVFSLYISFFVLSFAESLIVSWFLQIEWLWAFLCKLSSNDWFQRLISNELNFADQMATTQSKRIAFQRCTAFIETRLHSFRFPLLEFSLLGGRLILLHEIKLIIEFHLTLLRRRLSCEFSVCFASFLFFQARKCVMKFFGCVY